MQISIGTQKTKMYRDYLLQIGGPIWSAPIHSLDFVQQVLYSASENLNTYKRIEGVLNVILEELPDIPLYHTLDSLSGVLHLVTPKMILIR